MKQPPPGRSKTGTRWTAVAAAAVLSTVLGPGPAVAAAEAPQADRVSVRTLTTYSAADGETAENLVATRNRVFVSLAFASTVVAADRRGREQDRITLPTRGGFIAGLAWDDARDALAVSVSSPDPAIAGIWLIDADRRGRLSGERRLAALPADAFPNGLTVDPAGTLYAADSALGLVWRIRAGRDTAERFVVDPLLGRPAGSPLPAANGITHRGSDLFVSNTARQLLIRIPLDGDGPAGTPVVALAGLQIDDFALTRDGTLLAALNQSDTLVSVRSDRGGNLTGPPTPLAGREQGLNSPTAVAIVEEAHGRLRLYLTNAAFDAPVPPPSLQLVQLRSDRPGGSG